MRCRFGAVLIFLAGLLGSALAGEEGPPNQLSAKEKADGWVLLFDGKSTAGWHSFRKPTFPPRGWSVENGWLHCAGMRGGDIVSQALFEEFDLTWEYKQEPGGNSGVKYFVSDARSSPLGHEFQMLDDAGKPPGKGSTSSFYDVLPPEKNAVLPAGEINQARVLVRGDHVEHWLNGVKVIEYECGSETVKAAVANSKFRNTPGFGSRARGHILLTDHGTRCWFRNMKIRDLSKPSDAK